MFFFVHATLEIHAAGESLHDVLADLEEVFPNALCLKGWRGLVHYHVRGETAHPEPGSGLELKKT